MKTVLIVIVTGLTSLAAQAAPKSFSYTCNPLKGSYITSQLKVTLGKTSTVKVVGENGVACGAAFTGLTRDGLKAKFDLVGCEGTSSQFVVTADMLKGGAELKNGKRGGFARIDDHDDGGYFKSNFVCFRN